MDLRISLDTKERRKISTPPTPGIEPGRPARSQAPCRLSYLAHRLALSSSIFPDDYCCCCCVLQRSLTSQVISVPFYSDREKSDKFCPKALISAGGSFTCHKCTTRDRRDGFTSLPKEVILRIFTLGRDRTREPRIQRRV